MDTINIEDFKKVEIRIGKVIKCEKVEGADKLLKLQVDFSPAKQDSSERITRQVLSGIAEFYQPEEIEGKKLPFIVNLEPRMLRGLESQGMLLAVEGQDKPVLLVPAEDVAEGSIVV